MLAYVMTLPPVEVVVQVTCARRGVLQHFQAVEDSGPRSNRFEVTYERIADAHALYLFGGARLNVILNLEQARDLVPALFGCMRRR